MKKQYKRVEMMKDRSIFVVEKDLVLIFSKISSIG